MLTGSPFRASFRLLLLVACGAAAHAQTPEAPARPATAMRAAVENYAELAYRAYGEALDTARKFQASVRDFTRAPARSSSARFEKMRRAWLDMRPAYGRTEAFRFYQGPIDFGKQPDGSMGPEPLIDGWPVNEANIEYLINDPAVPITRATLVERNARDDEADVTTGFHALEFLLWGRDTDPNGPGNRPASDFVGAGIPARRRAYLEVTADLLVDNLQYVVDEWAPGRDNYRARFLAMKANLGVGHMLTGMSVLAGFEVAAERLATPLDSGSQEDEHSCFSDTTHIDIAADVQGIADVYYGRGTRYQGAALATAVNAANAAIGARLDAQLANTLRLAGELDVPFDRTLATAPGSPQRKKVEDLVTSLQALASLFRLGGSTLGVNVTRMTEGDND
jgi:putative iron-regulated protein